MKKLIQKIVELLRKLFAKLRGKVERELELVPIEQDAYVPHAIDESNVIVITDVPPKVYVNPTDYALDHGVKPREIVAFHLAVSAMPKGISMAEMVDRYLNPLKYETDAERERRLNLEEWQRKFDEEKSQS